MKYLKKTISILAIIAIMCSSSISSLAGRTTAYLEIQEASEIASTPVSSGSHQFNLQIHSISYLGNKANNRTVTATVYRSGGSVIYSNTYSGASTSRRTYSLTSSADVCLGMENNSTNSPCNVDHTWNAVY